MKKWTNTPETTNVAISREELLACMPYLHGDVIDNEFEAACWYEYARESAVLRESAQMHKSGTDAPEFSSDVERKFQCGYWFIQIPWGSISRCPSFPEKGWNYLSASDRGEIIKMGLFPF